MGITYLANRLKKQEKGLAEGMGRKGGEGVYDGTARDDGDPKPIFQAVSQEAGTEQGRCAPTEQETVLLC